MNYNSAINDSNFKKLPINNGDSGQYFCFDIILQKLYERMSYMTQRHSRVLFIRFDVRFPANMITDGSNTEITRLFKMLMDNSTYNGYGLQFAWVREQSQEKHQHYHCIALLNGNKVQSYIAFLHNVSHSWNYVLGVQCHGLIDFCNTDRNGNPVENGIMIRKPLLKSTGEERAGQELAFNKTFETCFHWASYLAKTNQKANTPKGVRRFGVSQMKHSQ